MVVKLHSAPSAGQYISVAQVRRDFCSGDVVKLPASDPRVPAGWPYALTTPEGTTTRSLNSDVVDAPIPVGAVAVVFMPDGMVARVERHVRETSAQLVGRWDA